LLHQAFILIFDGFFTTFALEENFEAYLSPILFLSPSTLALWQLSVEMFQSISSKTNFSASLSPDH